MLRKMTLCLAMAVVNVGIYAQHAHETHAQEASHTENHHGKHKLALYGGFTHVEAAFVEHETGHNATGKWVPTLGLDYFYTLNKHFDLGLISDLELDSYYVKDHNTSNTHFERINVLVLTPVIKYKPLHCIGIIAGAGVELEFVGKDEMKSFGVVKLGLEYEVAIKNGWELTPSFMLDLKQEYSTSALGISLGKRF